MRLKNWSVFTTTANEFMAPEHGTPHLQGNVYENFRFNDGDFVRTTRIVKIQDMGEYKLATTRSGSEYKLYKEDVSLECEKQFPNYYDRLKLN